jgi:c(7)-type cytochrome triheme protein
MRRFIACLAAILFVTSGIALAVPSGKVIEFKGSSLGTVKFDGAIHKKAAASCKECHSDGMFPQMKQGTVKITMEQIYAGKLCGACHNGKKAFDAKGNCQRCHIPPKK